ncbi:TPA: G5 domain-containing protein [Streptococcus pneumoniae]|nr:G5 domain-containing protein [Streptococcus pneumoniae]
MSLLKKDKFSIRKIKGIVGSVFLGSLLFAPSVVGASTYHYLDYSSLTQTERDQLKQGRPDESKESYALDYEKDALPNTGSSQSIMTALGLLAIGSLIVIITKDNRNKKIATFLIVGATGLVTLSTTSALNLNANIHESGRDGVLQISGYRYVGYLELDDKTVSSVSPASTVSPVEQPKVVTEKGEPEVQPALPEAVVTDKGEPEVQPTLPEAVVTDKGEPEVHEKPDYTQPIGANLVEPEVHEKLAYTESVGTTGMDENGNLIEPPVSDIPEYTESVGTTGMDENGNLIEPPVSDIPEYTESVGTTGVDENGNLIEPPVSDIPEYTESVGTTGVDENGNLIEPPVNDIPEYTEPISTVSEVASEREELPSLHTDIRTETIPKTTIEESDPSKFIGDDSVKEVGEDGERQIVTSYEELHGKKISEPVETVTILKEMKPKILVKGTKEKTVPVLTLTKVTEDAMNRSANLNYELDNKDNAEISSIIAEIKDGDTVVKKVDLSKEKLTDAVQNLDLFKDYKIATTMIYDRGQGSETSKLDEKTLRLELKKVEIKNISSTNLVKVNDDGTEIPSDFMSEKPSDEDVKKMYLKITSRDNKVTRLAVDKIELVTEKEKELYKITASAQDLIQHVDPSKTRNEYIHYIEKPVPKVNNVYYNFNELVRDMQEHPNDEFKLGADLNATNVSAFGKSYVTKDFKGKLLSDGDNHYTIHNLSRPLFGNVIGGTIKNINLGNVDINMPWANQVAAVANIIKGGTTIENVKVKGNIVGKDWVSGFIDKIDNQGTLRNVAFIGNVTSVGDGGQFLTGIVGENWKGLVERAYVNANLIGKKAKAAGIAYWTQNEGNNNTVRQEGAIKKSIAKGTIQVTEAIESGGVVGSMKHHGSVEDSVSMMKVPNGEIFYGSSDIDYDDGYWTGDNVRRNYVVIGVSDGHSSYQRSKDKNRIRPISEEEAKSKIEATGITADKYEINEPVVNRLNRLTRREDEYKSTQDYKVDRDLAYRNIEKLQPFYNKEWIVNQGNKLAEDSNLAKKEVLSVTGMKDGQFVTDLSDIDHVMIHYADKTKEIKAVHQKESKVAQVREYSIDGLDDIVYTPNMVDKNRDQLIKDIKDRLATVELISPEVRALMDKRDTSRDPNANSDERKNGYIRDLYFEESFSETKANLDKLVKSLIENADHQLNSDEAAMKALVKKVDENKAKIVMALTYLNRYYDIKYGDMTIKNLMMFKPDFYGKSVDLLDFLIRIGSSERNIKGDRTLDAYRDMIGGTIGKSELHGFLDYNMRLFTNDTDLNDWFIHAAKNVYIVEPKTTNPDFVNKRHRAFDGLNNGVHNRMILPLLTLKNAHMFLISTYNTMAYSSFEKYGKYTEAEREAFKDKIKEVAHAQQTYLDFWSRLALPSVRDQLLKSQNRVPTPVWDNQNYHNVEGVNRMGYDKNNKPIAPIRELYGPTWRYHTTNWYMGAMASIFQDPNNNDQVYFMGTNMISPFGISAFTHETTHVNDRMLYFGGHRHRQGTDVEAYAQGMLQTPDKSGNGEYGALGLNMAYHRENDGDQWYNYDPDKLKTREDIDRYMRNYNDALMMLDHLEADAVIPKLHGNISRWFKKMDRQYRKNGELHQFDKVRELTEDEKKKIVINNIDDLVNNNLMTKHGAPSDRTYNPEDFDSAYVNINMMTGIYGGNTSQGAPGAASFKHNTFRMWGYFGYENGFISYASSKYQGEADKTNKKLLGDDFIIKKVSKDKFNNLEEWKKQYFKDVKSKAEKGFTAIEIDGRQITNYAQLKTLFAEAVQKDIDGMSDPKIKDHFKNTVDLKSKVFKALLKNTDGFFNKLFKEDI